MRIDHPKSTWAILTAQQATFSIKENNARNDLLKRHLVDNSYRGFMLDSIHNNQNKLVEENCFMITNHKDEDSFRFDIINFLNLMSPVQEYALVKYKSEPVTYKVFSSGREEVFGKLKWGPSHISDSFVINNHPFSFEPVRNYKMNYLDYKKTMLYT